MFRPARILMREISAAGSTPAGVGTARSKPSTRMRTTRPLRNGSMWMSVARSSMARSSRSLTARTTGAPLARSRKDLDVVVGARRGRLVAVGRGFVVLAEPLRQHRGDVLVGGDLDLDRARRARSRRRAPPRHRSGRPPTSRHVPSARRIGKHQGLAQEAAGEFRRERRGRDQLRQADPRQAVEARDLLGKVIGRQVARFPKVSQRFFPVSAGG